MYLVFPILEVEQQAAVLGLVSWCDVLMDCIQPVLNLIGNLLHLVLRSVLQVTCIFTPVGRGRRWGKKEEAGGEKERGGGEEKGKRKRREGEEGKGREGGKGKKKKREAKRREEEEGREREEEEIEEEQRSNNLPFSLVPFANNKEARTSAYLCSVQQTCSSFSVKKCTHPSSL